MPKTVVFVHGWSVVNVSTYGDLPVRLAKESAARGEKIDVKEIYLGKYISFSDEVTLQDVSRAFDNALHEQLTGVKSFACITHSTGGPVIRDWLSRYNNPGKPQLSHLIMLAPANFGSALAQLGKSRVGRIKAWFVDGVEPGQKILDWLELGSAQAWKLNEKWIREGYSEISSGHYHFVLTGQSIDRKLYDNLNSYTGEMGSDGVVRVAAANLNSRYVRLLQQKVNLQGKESVTDKLELVDGEFKESYSIPLRIISGKSHTGEKMGIMESVRPNDNGNSELLTAIFDCLNVDSIVSYEALRQKFENETDAVQKKEKVELEESTFIRDRYFIHDRFSQVIFRVTDTEGFPVNDFDLLMTAGDNSDENMLPEGFSQDRQQNKLNPNTVTYYLNYDIMTGCEPVFHKKIKDPIRDGCTPISKLGLIIRPRPLKGFVRFTNCHIEANEDLLKIILHPNSTTLIDIQLQRMVSSNVFTLEKLGSKMPTKEKGDFRKTQPGDKIV